MTGRVQVAESGSVRRPDGEAPLASKFLSFALHLGAAFFAAMAICHWFGIKVPMKFIYFDNAFLPYQDRIIAICLVGVSLLHFCAARHPSLAPYVLVFLGTAIVGIGAITLSPDLAMTLEDGRIERNGWEMSWRLVGDHTPRLGTYWIETCAFASYFTGLVVLTVLSRRHDS